MLSSNAKIRIQSFGRFLSNMVMPNIGAFIAWGFITALFIPTGWLPNESLAALVGPMITYLLPLLIGYTGGKLMAGERGGVVGAITTMGVIVGSDIPMFMGAMMAGPLGGYVIKHVDAYFHGRVKSGFEMLVNNFSAGIVGMILALLAFKLIGPFATGIAAMLESGVDILVQNGLLPLTSVLVEPAKILFLNNAINHGVFSPLGIQESSEVGQSIFFLIEANPGPGLGVLLAYLMFGRGDAKQSSAGAVIIHFFGGIHEIYFPYVLMNPRLLLAVIAGGMTNVAVLSLFNAGLVSPASPGSIFAVLLMTPKASLIGVLLSVAASACVSFLVASFFVKRAASDEQGSGDLEAATAQMKSMKNDSKPAVAVASIASVNTQNIRKIVVACDAGMGSSAMGASVLRKKVEAAGLDIDVSNLAINDLTADIDIIVTHKDLTDRAVQSCPSAQHLSLTNFMDQAFYQQLVDKLSQAAAPQAQAHAQVSAQANVEPQEGEVLSLSNISLNLPSTNRDDAIRLVGRKLHDAGFVDEGYVEAMVDRESQVSTYMENGVAIPHGTSDAKGQVRKTGLVVCQFPEGIAFGSNGEKAKLLIGIAAKGNEHMALLSSLADQIANGELMELLGSTDSNALIYKVLSGQSSVSMA